MSALMTQPKLSQTERRLARRWVPAGATETKHPDGLGVVYFTASTNGGRDIFTVLAYAGTAKNHSFHFSYRKREDADAKVASFFDSLTKHKAFVAERRQAANAPTTLKVGDVVVNSWGYEQTNVDCYQVTRSTKNFVWLRPIASELVPDEGCGPMSGRVTPKPGEFLTGKAEEKHKSSGEYVGFEFGGSTKWDGKQTFYNSWYA